MSEVLQQLVEGNALSQAQSHQFFEQMITGNVEPALLAAVLTALKLKGESSEEIAGAATAIREHATAFPSTGYPVTDCVGTGGDGANTINISTTSAIVAASCGIKMAKHGNRSVSSMSGSADLLEAFGVNLSMSPEVAKQCLDETNLCFLFAPAYHAGFRHAGPVRQAMGIRTLFNILGPLVNPAKPSTMLLGVYTPTLLPIIAQSLKLTGVSAAWVVHGAGLDELALHGESTVYELKDSNITTKSISPADFGLPEYPLEALKGGTPEQNADIIKAILQGKGEAAHNAAVAINTAALLYLHGKAATLIEAGELAQQAIASGQAWDTLTAFATLSQQGAVNG
ncbi:anthranilate phosphoribosyltransferase [Thalassotalea agarivorans]|uniref:Anthranilate phosphoribosyltransferase n=1 Tax=Thalassotalea agarivorans TaxID=349064 RepID=A0A1I0ELY1_THASX|nr:anthranilate phosphoribosyltransferase [Thalassotalea agarivorans]SET46473.1 anthranilate phosphoribosyltransferase [Thalassotalea agarivorans]